MFYYRTVQVDASGEEVCTHDQRDGHKNDTVPRPADYQSFFESRPIWDSNGSKSRVIFFFNFTLYSAYTRVDRGNLFLRCFLPHAPSNFLKLKF